MRPLFLLVAGLAFAPGCVPRAPVSTVSSSACAAGDREMVRDLVYFGRNKPAGGEVSDAEWETFLAQVVTSRFPAGLTVVHATGQWRGASGAIERERAAVVTLLHSGEADQRRAVGEITGEYKTRFGQEAVLRERIVVCAAF